MNINFSDSELQELADQLGKFSDSSLFGSSPIEKLQNCNDLFGDVKWLLDTYDTDNSIYFSYNGTTNKCIDLQDKISTYKKRLEGFKEDFYSGYEIPMLDEVDATIEDIAAIDINNYTTKNIIGAEELNYNIDASGNVISSYTVTPSEINLEQVLVQSSYSDILSEEYEEMMELDPDMFVLEDGEVLSVDNYINMYATMGSFNYNTVKSDYLKTCSYIRLAINGILIAASVAAIFVTGGAALIPILAINAVATTIDVLMATHEVITGTDILSGEELSGGERAVTATFALLDAAFLPFDVGDIGRTTTNIGATTIGKGFAKIDSFVSTKYADFINYIPNKFNFKNQSITENLKVSSREQLISNINLKKIDNIEEITLNDALVKSRNVDVSEDVINRSNVIGMDPQELQRKLDVDPEYLSNNGKGNYGEISTADYVHQNGIGDVDAKYLSDVENFDNCPTSLDDTIDKGIDHIFSNSNPPPDYFVVESKYNTAQLNKLSNGTRQMDDDWIKPRLTTDIEEMFNNDLITIEKYLSRTMPDGTISLKYLGEMENN